MRSSVATMMPPRSRACIVTVRTYAERERFMQRRQQLEQQHAAQVSVGLALSAARERGLRVERDRQDAQEAEREVTRLVRRNGPRHPPPPLPCPSPQPEEESTTSTTASTTTTTTTTTTAAAAAAVVASTAPAAAPTVSSTSSSTVVAPSSSSSAVSASIPPPPAFASTAVAAPKVVAKPPTAPSTANGAARVNGSTPASNGVSTFQARLRPVQQNQQQPQQQRVARRSPSPAPSCPTPDYDSDSSGSTLHTTSTAWTPKASTPASVGAAIPEVEMQSLDSLELLEPRTKQPRPPQTYFPQNRAVPVPRPSVSVTIREYGGGNSRQPSKLTFLNGVRPLANGSGGGGAPNAASQDGLQSELAATLSRSNLRTVVDSTTADGPVKEADEISKGVEASRGNVTVTSVNSGVNNLAKVNVPNGILKKASVTHMVSNGTPVGHGITPALLAGAGAALRNKSPGISTKTISFGAKATIINEKPQS